MNMASLASSLRVFLSGRLQRIQGSCYRADKICAVDYMADGITGQPLIIDGEKQSREFIAFLFLLDQGANLKAGLPLCRFRNFVKLPSDYF